MKIRFVAMAAVTLLVGCVSIPEPLTDGSRFVYPHSDFVSETNVTAWAGLKSIGITNHADYVRVMSKFFSNSDVFTPDERAALEKDPFLVTPDIPLVVFQTTDPAERVAKYYQVQFEADGWEPVRGILLVEYCNGGGDWVRVYRKGDALVHLHIVGIWRRDRDEERSMAEGWFYTRSILFTFLGITPSTFLGSEYRSTTVNDPT